MLDTTPFGTCLCILGLPASALLLLFLMERYYALSSSLLVAGGRRAGARWAGYGFGAIFRLSFDAIAASLHHHRIAIAWSQVAGHGPVASGPAVIVGTIDTT